MWGATPSRWVLRPVGTGVSLGGAEPEEVGAGKVSVQEALEAEFQLPGRSFEQ